MFLAFLAAASARPGVPPPPAAVTPERTNIAAAAFLQPTDTGDVAHAFQLWTAHVLPPLCGARFASDTATTAAGRIMALYHPRRAEGYIPSDVLHQTIAVYRPGGAAAFMRELRRAVAACPVDARSRHCLRRAPAHGDDAILGRTRFPERSNDGPTGRTATEWFLAVRIGDAVMVLANSGYEYGHVDAATFAEIGARAAGRLATWARR